MAVTDLANSHLMTPGWSLHATTDEIAGEQVRMAAVGAGDGDPGYEGEKFDDAVKFYGPSVIAHAAYLLLHKGMTRGQILDAALKELDELLEMD